MMCYFIMEILNEFFQLFMKIISSFAFVCDCYFDIDIKCGDLVYFSRNRTTVVSFSFRSHRLSLVSSSLVIHWDSWRYGLFCYYSPTS